MIRSIGSASSCSPATERLDERGHDRVLLGLRHRRPPRRAPRRLAGQGVGARHLSHRGSEGSAECSSTRPSPVAGPTRSKRSDPSATRCKRWRTEILNHHRTGASNGPTEGLNLCVKKVKRAGRGFTCFEHYRLRVLLHAGGVTWPQTSITAEDPNPLSPLKRVGPVNLRAAAGRMFPSVTIPALPG